MTEDEKRALWLAVYTHAVNEMVSQSARGMRVTPSIRECAATASRSVQVALQEYPAAVEAPTPEPSGVRPVRITLPEDKEGEVQVRGARKSEVFRSFIRSDWLEEVMRRCPDLVVDEREG